MLTLYYFEHVDNNVGVWCRTWAGTREEAEALRTKRIEYYGDEVNLEEETHCGEYAEVGTVDEILIEPTLEGVLGFANNYALGGE